MGRAKTAAKTDKSVWAKAGTRSTLSALGGFVVALTAWLLSHLLGPVIPFKSAKPEAGQYAPQATACEGEQALSEELARMRQQIAVLSDELRQAREATALTQQDLTREREAAAEIRKTLEAESMRSADLESKLTQASMAIEAKDASVSYLYRLQWTQLGIGAALGLLVGCLTAYGRLSRATRRGRTAPGSPALS